MRAILFLAIFGALTLSPARAQAPWDRAALEAAFREIRTVRAEFLQKRYLPILKEPILSEGRFFFEAGGALRWEYLKPVRTVMLQKGEAVRLFQFGGEGWKPEISPAVEARKMVLAEINAWLQGRFGESKAFSHRLSPGPPVRIFLAPREGINKFIEGIEIVLGEKPGVIERIEITESGGGRMIMEFRNVEINSRLPAGIFDNP